MTTTFIRINAWTLLAFTLIALIIGLALTNSADAKGKEPPMATRVANSNTQCTDGGGTASNQVLDGGATMVTHCAGGAADGLSCTITHDNTVCKHEGRISDSGPLGGVIIVGTSVADPTTTDTQIVTAQVQAVPAIQTAP